MLERRLQPIDNRTERRKIIHSAVNSQSQEGRQR